MDSFIRDILPYNLSSKIVDNLMDVREELENISLSIFHLNFRNLMKNGDELDIIFEQISKRFDFIVLIETFEVCDLDIFQKPGYRIYNNEGDVTKNDGLMVYVNEYLEVKSSLIRIDSCNCIEFDFRSMKETFKITSIYI